MPLPMMRLRVGLDWLLDLFFGREITELPAIRPGEMTGQPPLAGQQRKPREEQEKREEVVA